MGSSSKSKAHKKCEERGEIVWKCCSCGAEKIEKRDTKKADFFSDGEEVWTIDPDDLNLP